MQIKREFVKNKKILKYIFLPICLGLLVFSLLFPTKSLIQVEIIFSAAIVYIGLSLFYHHVDKTLTFETALEYILIAILVTIILVGAIFY